MEGVSTVAEKSGLAGESFLGLPVEDWINLGLSLLIVLAGYLVGTWLIRRVLPQVVQRTDTRLDDHLVQSVGPELRWLVVVLTLEFATKQLSFLSPEFKTLLADVYFFLALVMGTRITWRLIGLADEWYRQRLAEAERLDSLDPVMILLVCLGRVIVGVIAIPILLSRTRRLFLQQQLPRTGLNPSLAQILTTFAGYLVVFAGVMIALNLMRIPLTSLTVILGGLSVGIGFSLQDILSNFIAGIVLMFEGAIVPGDVLEVDQTTGVVTEVGVRSMRMRTYDNVEIVVPNSRFLTQEVTNYSSRGRRVRVRIPIGVTSSADPRKAEAAILRAAHHLDVLNDPPPSVYYVDFSSDNHDFELCVWTEDATKIPEIKSDLRYTVWEGLTAKDIGLPLPGLDLYVRSMPSGMASEGPGRG